MTKEKNTHKKFPDVCKFCKHYLHDEDDKGSNSVECIDCMPSNFEFYGKCINCDRDMEKQGLRKTHNGKLKEKYVCPECGQMILGKEVGDEDED